MYIIFMRKILDVERLTSKVGAPVKDTVSDARVAAQAIGRAAESQARLNIALTMVAVSALLVALLLVRDMEGRR